MNTLWTNGFSSERQECNDIYQILGHSAIFNPLFSCVFPDLQGILNKREERELFLQQPEIIQQILDFFKDQEKWCLFEEELLAFYNTHKESLNPTEAQKNMVGIAIWAMKKYISNLSNIKPNLSTPNTTDHVKWMQGIFQNLVLEQLPKKEILSDIGWNMILPWESWEKILFFDIEIAKVGRIFIDVETRVPIIIQWRYAITNIISNNTSYYTVDLYDTVKKQFILKRCIKDDFTILTDNKWNDISNIYWFIENFFWNGVKFIEVAKQISKYWVEYVRKFTDSDFNTLRDEKWREIIWFYKWNGNVYSVLSIDDKARKRTTFYNKEWNEIKWFFKNLWLRLYNIL